MIAQVPLAPVPVGDGTSEPIARPRFVLAPDAVDDAVPPLAIATTPDTLPAVVAVVADVADVAVVAEVALVAVAALPEILIAQVPLASPPVLVGTFRFVLASAAVDAPVPPSAIAISVIPVTDPPVIDTLVEACVAIVLRPRLLLAVAASEAPVPPSAIARSVMPVIEPPDIVGLLIDTPDREPPEIDTLDDDCVAIVPSPRFVLASAAVEAPVPPSAIAMSVMPVIDPPVIETLPLDCVASDPSPRLVLASAAVEAPVPPSAIARSVIPAIDPPVIATLDAA